MFTKTVKKSIVTKIQMDPEQKKILTILLLSFCVATFFSILDTAVLVN